MEIAILGYGVVGSGTHEILEHVDGINVKKILTRKPSLELGDKSIQEFEEILNDNEIEVIVECMGGLHPAYEYVSLAMKNGKHVVTPNKSLVAAYWQDLHSLARENNVELRFTSSAGGGIPWLFNLKRQARSDEIVHVSGIVNGTCNYILDAMHSDNIDFMEVLKKAQELGYAEKDPTDDICGFDTQRKCVISANIAFGTRLSESDIPVFGIKSINTDDIKYFIEHDYVCRLLMSASKHGEIISAYVEPTLLPVSALEANVKVNNNLISLIGKQIGKLSFYGQGAGKLPTGTSVVQDIIDIASNWKFNIKAECNINSIDNNSIKHRYYIREYGKCRITDAISVGEAHALAAHSSDNNFFMAGIKE